MPIKETLYEYITEGRELTNSTKLDDKVTMKKLNEKEGPPKLFRGWDAVTDVQAANGAHREHDFLQNIMTTIQDIPTEVMMYISEFLVGCKKSNPLLSMISERYKTDAKFCSRVFIDVPGLSRLQACGCYNSHTNMIKELNKFKKKPVNVHFDSVKIAKFSRKYLKTLGAKISHSCCGGTGYVIRNFKIMSSSIPNEEDGLYYSQVEGEMMSGGWSRTTVALSPWTP
jgi:hypothetical protein